MRRSASSKITMQDIADTLGISKSLVSRALGNDGKISERTKEQVRLTALELGYPLNSSLAAVPSSRTGNIAVLMPRSHLKDGEFWGHVVSGAEEALHRASFSLVLAGVEGDDSPAEGMPSCITDRKVDGAIFMGRVSAGVIAEVLASGIPVVLADVRTAGLKLDHVLADNFRGGGEAALHLLEKGHRRLLFAGDPAFSFSFAERKRGALQAVRDFGDGASASALASESAAESASASAFIEAIPSELEGGYKLVVPIAALEEALQRTGATAVVCANDSVAFSVIENLQALGLRCPEDVSVVGFDNVERCEWVTPKLTSVDAGKTTIGRRAVELLLRRMNDSETRPETRLVATELVERQSVAVRELR
ncbi:LacI family DNA-binding transcriptional regulator [Cohnella fermenti]|nr:substrate-binding domain-containing protein [Cohnella fermenti]